MYRGLLVILFFFSFCGYGQTRSIEEGLKRPLEVVHLKLKRERLTEFPLEIIQFKNLEILDLSNNKLESIPKEISKLKKLKRVILSKNNLVDFPLVFLQMNELVYIDLWDNYIENLPAEIKQKENLQFLDIRGVLLKPDIYSELSFWFDQDILKISPPCDCMYK